MTTYRRFLVSLVLLFPAVSLASFSDLYSIFQDHFHRKYRPRYCGENAMNFVKAAYSTAQGTTQLYVVYVENKGFTVFGMVNAEHTRGSRFNKPSVEEANWYHHAFVMDGRGNVYDFDFGISPKVVPMKTYLETMFLNESECSNPQSGRFCAGRDNKLKDYEFSAIAGKNVVYGADAKPTRKVPMSEVHKDWRNLLR